MNVGLSLIGTPDGFESVSVGLTERIRIGRKVDLDNSVINIVPDTDILVVRREIDGGQVRTYVTYYRFAKEIRTSRTGSFYGSSLVYEGGIPKNCDRFYRALEDLANLNRVLCIDGSDNRFSRHLNDIDLRMQQIPDIESLFATATKVNSEFLQEQSLGKRCFLRLDDSVRDYPSFLDQVIGNGSESGLGLYETVYTSRHPEVIKEVITRRGLEIETLHSLVEKKQARLAEKRARASIESHGRPPARIGFRLAPRPAEQVVEPAPGVREANSGAEAMQLAEQKPNFQGETSTGRERTQPSVTDSTAEEQDVATARRDGFLVALARYVEELLRTKKNALVAWLILVASVFAIIAYAAKPLILRFVWGETSDSSGYTFYYTGCMKTRADRDLVADKCNPERVADDFKTQLTKCTALSEFLETQSAEDRDSVLEGIEDQVKRSLERQATVKQISDSPVAMLSQAEAASFQLTLKFPRSSSCVKALADGGNFLQQPPQRDSGRIASRTSNPEESGQPSPSPSVRPSPTPRNSPTAPRNTSTARPAATPKESPAGAENATPTPSPKPKKDDKKKGAPRGDDSGARNANGAAPQSSTPINGTMAFPASSRPTPIPKNRDPHRTPSPSP